MASKRRTATRAKQRKDDDGKIVVTTSRGHRVECLPISTLIDQVRAQYEDRMPDAPTYTITDAGGSTVEVPHTAETIADDATSAEEKQAWGEYQAQVAEIEAEMNERTLRAVAVKGIRVLTMPPEEEWVEEHEFMGLVVPEKAHERLYHYIRTDVLGTAQDGVDIMAGIYRASGVDEEVLARIEGSFRPEVGRSEGADAGASAESPTEEKPQGAEGVVELPDVPDGGSDGTTGPDAE